MKKRTRLLTFALLSALALSAVTGCTPSKDPVVSTEGATTQTATTVEETTEEVTTREPARVVKVDNTYRIVIAAEADEFVQRAANQVVESLKEKAGLELTLVTDAETPAEHEIVLGNTNRTETELGSDWEFSLQGDSFYLDTDDSLTLYFAAEAVMDAWLTPDFGLAEEGTLTLSEDRVVDLNAVVTKRDTAIKVMTQNIRDADDGGENNVPKRYERLKLLLIDYLPDVIGTQENSRNWLIRFEKLYANMSPDEKLPVYGMVGSSVDGHEAIGGGRNTIFYRLDRFDLIETDTFWLSETPHLSSSLEGAEHKRTCTWAKLYDKKTGKTVLFMSTHLDHKSNRLRELQITILLDYMADKFGDFPIYLVGDLNTGSYSTAFQILSDKMLVARDNAWINASTKDYTFHGYSEYGGSLIDHIFYNEYSTPIRYEILSKDYGGYVSDHYGVLTEFIFE